MNFRIRDNALYWSHRLLAAAGKIRADPLEKIRKDGFHRVLVVATTAIGDAVLCMPLIDSLRAARPDARISFFVSAGAACLFEGRSGLDVVLPYHGKYRQVRRTMDWLRAEKYDLALVANANDPDVIPLIWWSGCRRIIRRPQRHTIYSFMVANPEMLSKTHTSGHAIDRNLQFCDLLHVPRGPVTTRLEVQPGSRTRVEELLAGAATPFWIIHPGASRLKKEWGIENYAGIARRILADGGGSVILTGSAGEQATCDALETRCGGATRVLNLAGKLRLDELAALFSKAALLISGDTGPFHIAMAVGAATVTLFAPWDPGSTPAINGPCFDPARHPVVTTQQMGDPISAISADQVWAACAPFLIPAC